MKNLVETAISRGMRQNALAYRARGATPGHVRNTGSANIRNEKLWRASLKFEALLLQQIMSAMRKTVPESGLLPTGFANDVYDSMFDHVVAEAGSRRSSLGIASSIYRQLDRSHRIQAQAPATDNGISTTGILDQPSGEKHGEN